MQKENKRCLPKGGRPHAQGVCQKKRKRREKMHTQRRYATCLQRHVKKNEEERKEPTVDNQGERVMQKSSSMNHQKYSTHLHILIRLYDSFLLGSCF